MAAVRGSILEGTVIYRHLASLPALSSKFAADDNGIFEESAFCRMPSPSLWAFRDG